MICSLFHTTFFKLFTERKRNSAFLKTTGKGQPVLNARMKVLYSQIQKSFGSGAI